MEDEENIEEELFLVESQLHDIQGMIIIHASFSLTICMYQLLTELLICAYFKFNDNGQESSFTFISLVFGHEVNQCPLYPP
jgi:hypothetical protein